MPAGEALRLRGGTPSTCIIQVNLWLDHPIFYLGATYAIGARLVNVLFLVLSLIIPRYRVTVRPFRQSGLAALDSSGLWS
jgi:hypothetical protein